MVLCHGSRLSAMGEVLGQVSRAMAGQLGNRTATRASSATGAAQSELRPRWVTTGEARLAKLRAAAEGDSLQ
ncbi:hypothetical protein NL676_010783 [Syzygium grande]|nr:hypothetical protein NL676_010783 [Syzygium grande]